MSEEEITNAVIASTRYRYIGRDTVARVVHGACIRFGTKRAEQETKRLLHQMWGVYYATTKLSTIDSLDRLLAQHQSTRERLPFIREFYDQIFSITGAPSTIVDYACGLNPLAFSTLGFRYPAQYCALDIDDLTVETLNRWFVKLKLTSRFTARRSDLLIDKPVHADVSLLLKVLPPLELQQKGSSSTMIKQQPSRFVIASYPIKSVSGKEKGMLRFYTSQFYEIAEGQDWNITELIFDNELVFVIEKA